MLMYVIRYVTNVLCISSLVCDHGTCEKCHKIILRCFVNWAMVKVPLCHLARKQTGHILHPKPTQGTLGHREGTLKHTVSSSCARTRNLSRWLWTMGSRLSAAVFIRLASTATNIDTHQPWGQSQSTNLLRRCVPSDKTELNWNMS